MSTALELRGVTRRYEERAALEGVDLAIADGEYVTVLGPSGAGKSVLLRVIAGFEAPDEGEIVLDGASVAGVPPHRRRIGFVFQGFALFPHLTVARNVAYGLRHGNGARGRELSEKVDELLALVGLEGLGERDIAQISGGQKQRVALARTLATEPAIVLLDEPLGALDANLRDAMKVELRAIQERTERTFVHVTGNEDEALAMADRMLVLDRGRVAQFEPPRDVFARPASARVAHLLNSYNLLPGEIEGAAFRSGADVFTLPDESERAVLRSGADAPALPDGLPPGPGTYGVRFDAVDVLAIDEPAPADHDSLIAEYVSREYAGAFVTFLFERPGGGRVEGRYHLHARRPEQLELRRSYRLVWPRSQARVYPEVLA